MSKFSFEEDGIKSEELASRRYRLTVPISNFPDESLAGLPRRIDLGENAVLVRLDEFESTRLEEANLSKSERRYHKIRHRIEILDLQVERIYDQWSLFDAQWMLVIRRPLSVFDTVLDRNVGGEWRRGGRISVAQRDIMINDIPADRLNTLRELRVGAGCEPSATLRRAMKLYAQSVIQLNYRDRDNSFVLASMSLENLLGHELKEGTSFRLSLRASALSGNSSIKVFNRIKDLYNRRSRLIHSGRSVSFTDTTHLQQLLMRLIPTMCALENEFGSYEKAIKYLDQTIVDRNLKSSEVISGPGWWNYVSIEECFDRSYSGFDDPMRERRVWLFDY